MSGFSYDNIIMYWDEEAWKKYFFKDLGNLYGSCNKIVAINEYLKDEIDKQPLSEILDKELLFKILLGGLKEDGTYDEEGLAIFCNKFFGTGISKPAEFIGRLKVGMPLREASKDLEGVCTSTTFLDILNKIRKSLEDMLYHLKAKGFIRTDFPKADIKEIVKDPKDVCREIGEFIQSCLSVSPNYNPHTFFITSLYRITRKYMEFAYPKLKDEKTFNFIKELLGLYEIIIPEIPDEKMTRDYTVWGLHEGSVGYNVIAVLNNIWDLADLDVIQKYFNLKSERKTYLERAIEAWKRANPSSRDWDDVIRFIRICGSSSSSKWGILKLNNPRSYMEIYSEEGTSSLEGINLKTKDYTTLFTKFMDYISPQMFLNIGSIGRAYGNLIRWEAVGIIG